LRRTNQDGSLSCEGYATMLARPSDVDRLCALEDEFVDDHRKLLLGSNISEKDLFEQIRNHVCWVIHLFLTMEQSCMHQPKDGKCLGG